MNANGGLRVGAVLMLGALVVGCSSSTEEPAADEPVIGGEKAGEGIIKPATTCYYETSDVVQVHISFADYHCEGWSGKVFCEYESLSSTLGPGWGTCQCYDYWCEEDGMHPKGGRACRSRRCG